MNETGMNKNTDRTGLGIAFGLIGVILFGGTVPATRVAVSELNPWFITFGRAAIAAGIAAVLLFLTEKRLERSQWIHYLLASFCLVLGFPGFLGLALETVPAAHSGVVLGLLPLTTSVFAVLFAGERPSSLFWFWAILGAALVLAFTFRDGVPGFVIGDFWLACATLSASLGYVLSGKLTRVRPGWEVICWQLIVCAPIILVGTWFFYDPNIETASLPVLLGFSYVALVSMLLGFFAWNAGLALGGIARVSQLQLLQTFVTLALAALLLGEKVSLNTWAYAAGIVAVILFARWAQIDRRQ